MIKRITITGTESTGKTELAGKLATHYKTIHVPDFSRTYVKQLGRKYNHADVLHIAKGIIEQENKMLHYAHGMLFSDNDLTNIKIWLQYYKWSVPEWLEHEIEKRKSDLYLLCDIDVVWEADAQRANPHDREELKGRFVNELIAMNANFKWIKGKGDSRLQNAIQQVDDFLHP